jgi:hypothetical protein
MLMVVFVSHEEIIETLMVAHGSPLRGTRGAGNVSGFLWPLEQNDQCCTFFTAITGNRAK